MAQSEADTTTIIQQGLQGAFWERFLRPYLVERSKQALRTLLKKTAEDDINRGRFAAFEEILNLPDNTLKELELEAVRRDVATRSQNYENFRVEAGFKSPYKPAPAPGDLTQDESDQSSDGQPV